jgi:hypothetical protein
MTFWGEDELWLFTPEEFEQLPDGIELTSIVGTCAVKGRNEIDQDTRGGYLAWGVRDPLNHEYAHLFTIFGLKR